MNSAIMMLENTAKKYPNKIAVRDENTILSFRKYREQAMSVGTYLLKTIYKDLESIDDKLFMHDKKQNPVIVYMPKSAEMLVCFAGAMYSGNPYVPVDSEIPLERLKSIAENMGNGFIVTNKDLAKNLEGLDFNNVQILLYEDMVECVVNEKAVMCCVNNVIDCDPIYIMYTSGSTGVPKGVTIPHRGIIDYSDWLEKTFDFDSETILGNQSSFFFDNSTFDIYTMMRTGAELVIIPEVLFRFPTKLPDFIIEQHINTIFWVPTVLIAIANSGILAEKSMKELKKVLFCGEAMPNAQLNIWRQNYPDIMYANLYGPTEITDVCIYYKVDKKFKDTEPLPIGKPCRNMRAIILREDNTQADIGETGQLCIAGSALSLGYWNSKDITDKAFIQNPINSIYDDRLYKTGDLAYLAEDGNIIFIGRMDSQIKLKGKRIELGESETIAKSLPEIENACVLFDALNSDIVLFAQTSENLKLRKLNMSMRKFIPTYMLPTKLICMEKLPLTPNGKIDRVKLRKEYIDNQN